jgi:hypothetical protein
LISWFCEPAERRLKFFSGLLALSSRTPERAALLWIDDRLILLMEPICVIEFIRCLANNIARPTDAGAKTLLERADSYEYAQRMAANYPDFTRRFVKELKRSWAKGRIVLHYL